MYKNQLQELAQRSCFNLPSYSCIREGPDHAPRFKATVNFNGEAFESPMFYSTLRQAEHAAAEVALNTLACRGPSRVLASRVLDETGVYKNLLQETAHRAGLKLPAYTTVRSGPGHVPSYKCTVELAGMSFSGEPARTKKQAQKNAAMAAWSALKRSVQRGTQRSAKSNEEQEQVNIAHFLASIPPSDLRNKQVDGQQIQERYFPVCQELSTPSNFYATQCQSWVYPCFSHEMALCQMWQHEHLLQLQQSLFSLQVSPPPVLSPQSLPHVHATLSPTSYSFVPVKAEPSPTGPELGITTSRSSLCFSDQIVGDPIRGKSTVSIQEIHEGKPEGLSAILPSIGPDSKLLAHVDGEARLKEVVPHDEQQKNAERESKTESAPRYKSVDSQVQNPCGYDASSSHRQCPPHPSSSFPRSFRPSSVAHPVMIRPVRPAPPSSAHPVSPMGAVLSSPRPQDSAAARIHVPPRLRTGVSSHSAASCSPIKMKVGSMQPRYLAPAVRIRSVVPVCSAPPARKTSIPCQEPVLPPKDEVDVVLPSQVTPPSS